MTTDSYKALRELSERQQIALEALLEGKTHAEAAERAGVHRVTVSKWSAGHPAFQAELNRRRAEINVQRAARLRELDAAALDAVAAQLETNDAEFAMKWLKLRGLDTAAAHVVTGPTDAERIIDELVKRESQKARDAEIFERISDVDRASIRERVEDDLAQRFAATDD
jgi:hypothetical protein